MPIPIPHIDMQNKVNEQLYISNKITKIDEFLQNLKIIETNSDILENTLKKWYVDFDKIKKLEYKNIIEFLINEHSKIN